MAIDINKVVERYVLLRDKKAEIAKAAKDQTALIEAALEKLEVALLAHFNETGQTSTGTPSGTAFITKKTSANVADFDALLTWIRERDAWQFLDKRVNKTAVQEFREAEGDLPPGVDWREEKVVQIRRS